MMVGGGYAELNARAGQWLLTGGSVAQPGQARRRASARASSPRSACIAREAVVRLVRALVHEQAAPQLKLQGMAALTPAGRAAR